MMEVGGPAAGAGGTESLYPGGLAGEGPIRFEPGDEQGRATQTPAQHRAAPVQPRPLEFPGLSIGAQGMLADQVQLRRDKVEDLLVPKPQGGMYMHFQRRRLAARDAGGSVCEARCAGGRVFGRGNRHWERALPSGLNGWA